MNTVTPGMQDLTPVEVITHHHRYCGLVPNSGKRVADILADLTTDIFELRKAVADTVGSRAKGMEFKQVSLKKSRILMVLLRGEHESPIRRSNRYVERQRYGTLIVVSGYLLSGILHLGSCPIPSLLLTQHSTLPSFIGMTNVTFHSSIDDRLPSECGVAIVQRQFIEAVQLGDKPLPKQAMNR